MYVAAYAMMATRVRSENKWERDVIRFLLKQCAGMASLMVFSVNLGGASGRLTGLSGSVIPSA